MDGPEFNRNEYCTNREKVPIYTSVALRTRGIWLIEVVAKINAASSTNVLAGKESTSDINACFSNCEESSQNGVYAWKLRG